MKKVFISTLCGISLCVSAAFAYETMAERTDRELSKYNHTGEFVKCVRYNQITRTKILDDKNILFELRNNKYALNTLSSECKSLGFNRKFSLGTKDNKVCDYDFISTQFGECGLSKFQVLEKKS